MDRRAEGGLGGAKQGGRVMNDMKRRVSSPHVLEPPPQTFSRCIQVGNQLFGPFLCLTYSCFGMFAGGSQHRQCCLGF